MSATRRLLSISAARPPLPPSAWSRSRRRRTPPPPARKCGCASTSGTPGVDERLQTGKNPIRVSGNSADKDKDGQVFVGDQFADAQGRSVVVQIEGDGPGCRHCSPTDGPPAGPTAKPTEDLRRATAHRIRVARAGDVPVGLVGGGALLVGAALVAAEAERRRRAATHR